MPKNPNKAALALAAKQKAAKIAANKVKVEKMYADREQSSESPKTQKSSQLLFAKGGLIQHD